MKSTKGITLIALIITIIVMLILAGVAVVALSNTGLFDRTRESADLFNEAAVNEQETLGEYENELNNASSGNLGGVNKIKNPASQIIGDGRWIEEKGINSPQLGGDLTPVMWNSPESEPKTENQWYDYIAQTGTTENGGTSRWANAKTPNEDYLVWIPRYAYKITKNHHNYQAGTIDVIFVDINNKNGDTTYSTEYPVVSGNVMQDYVVHPAFTNAGNGGFGELAGIWVGKFQSSSSTPSATNGGGNVTNLDVKIVPNVPCWRYINIGNIFTVCQAFSTNNGLTGMDSHMMKNTEWGAVAYLAHSKYGRNGTEVTINNHHVDSKIKTGYAGYTVGADTEITNVRTIEDNTSTSGTFPYNNI